MSRSVMRRGVTIIRMIADSALACDQGFVKMVRRERVGAIVTFGICSDGHE